MTSNLIKKSSLILLFPIFSTLFICLIQANYEKPKNEYGSGYSNEYEVKYGQGRRIIDEYVCDLDASVLVVTSSDNAYKKGSTGEYNEGANYGTNSYPAGYEETKVKRTKRSENEYKNNYGGHSSSYKVAKAHRLRCSIIASGSDEDCRKCCHMAARKERSIAKDSIFGFVVDYDEINLLKYSSSASSGPYRSKRDATPSAYTPSPNKEYKKEEEEYKQQQSTYASPPSINYQNYYNNYPKSPNNPRCVCCSPRVYSVDQNEGYNNNNYYYGNKKSRGYYGKKNDEYNNKEEEYKNEEYGQQQRGGYENEGYRAPKYNNNEEYGTPKEGYGEYDGYGINKYEEYPKPKENNNNYYYGEKQGYNHHYDEQPKYHHHRGEYENKNYNHHHGREYNSEEYNKQK